MFSEDQRFWILAYVFSELRFLDLGSCFQRTKGFGALAHDFRGPKVLDPGSCFQKPRILGLWLMFSEDQRFLGLWLMFSEDQRFWILAHILSQCSPKQPYVLLVFDKNSPHYIEKRDLTNMQQHEDLYTNVCPNGFL